MQYGGATTMFYGSEAIDKYNLAISRFSNDGDQTQTYSPSVPQRVFFNETNASADAFFFEATVPGPVIDMMVGFVVCRAARHREFGVQHRGILEIGLVWTEPYYRHQGIAVKLLNQLCQCIERENSERFDMLAVHMQSCVQHPATLGVYDSAGFRAITGAGSDGSSPVARVRSKEFTNIASLIEMCSSTEYHRPLVVLVKPLAVKTKGASSAHKRRLEPTPV
jgi:ribosomal protein S18 acetylase RimI-like enzyme